MQYFFSEILLITTVSSSLDYQQYIQFFQTHTYISDIVLTPCLEKEATVFSVQLEQM